MIKNVRRSLLTVAAYYSEMETATQQRIKNVIKTRGHTGFIM